MKNSNRFVHTIELITVLGLALILGACTNRSTVPLYSGNLTENFGCTATSNPSNTSVTVDGNGNIVGTGPVITFSVSPTVAGTQFQIMSISGYGTDALQMQSNYSVPTAAMTFFNIQFRALKASAQSLTFTVQNSANEFKQCSASVSFQTTVSAPTPGALVFPLAADFSGDGVPDQAGWDSVTGFWWVTLGGAVSGSPVKWGAWGSMQSWLNVTAVDINGDNKKDIVGRDAANGNWWAAVSNGSSFSNLYLGSFGAGTWNNIQFEMVNGVYSITATDASGSRFALSLNATQGSPGSLVPLAPAMALSLSSSPVIPGVTTGISIPYGGTAYATWNVTNGTSCVIYAVVPATGANIYITSGNSGTAFPIPNITQNLSIGLGCNGSGGYPTAPVLVPVAVAVPPSGTVAINGPTLVERGVPVSLTWSAQNVIANSCSLRGHNNALIPLTGPTVSAPAQVASTTYKLTCQHPVNGAIVRTVTVPLAAVVTLSPTSMNFGSVSVNTDSNVQTLTVSSADNIARIDTWAAPADFNFDPGTCGSTFPIDVPAGGNCTVRVKFRPSAQGSVSKIFVLNYKTKGFPLSRKDAPPMTFLGTGKAAAGPKG